MGFRVSVDTGGTFTDVVVADEDGHAADWRRRRRRRERAFAEHRARASRSSRRRSA